MGQSADAPGRSAAVPCHVTTCLIVHLPHSVSGVAAAQHLCAACRSLTGPDLSMLARAQDGHECIRPAAAISPPLSAPAAAAALPPTAPTYPRCFLPPRLRSCVPLCCPVLCSLPHYPSSCCAMLCSPRCAAFFSPPACQPHHSHRPCRPYPHLPALAPPTKAALSLPRPLFFPASPLRASSPPSSPRSSPFRPHRRDSSAAPLAPNYHHPRALTLTAPPRLAAIPRSTPKPALLRPNPVSPRPSITPLRAPPSSPRRPPLY
ncbi:unnamed protein product [Closterium sp. Naga37s-1]|nr:unnamed protein product [Closterium sp. Naga37s-1]